MNTDLLAPELPKNYRFKVEANYYKDFTAVILQRKQLGFLMNYYSVTIGELHEQLPAVPRTDQVNVELGSLQHLFQRSRNQREVGATRRFAGDTGLDWLADPQPTEIDVTNTEKLYIGGVDSDDQKCLRCGSWYLDTGWECNDCGYDNMPHYCPPELMKRSGVTDR